MNDIQRRLALALFLMPGVLLAPAQASAQAPRHLTPQSAVPTLRFEWNSAMTFRDTARIGNLLMEEAVFLSDETRLDGRQAVTAVFAELFARYPDVRLEFSTTELQPARPVVTDSTVSEYGTWSETFATAGGVVVLDGTYLDIWHRMPQGWRIAVHAFAVTSCRGNPGYCRGDR